MKKIDLFRLKLVHNLTNKCIQTEQVRHNYHNFILLSVNLLRINNAEVMPGIISKVLFVQQS